MLFSAIIVDDEPYAREELIYILSQFESCNIIGQAGNARDCISLYLKFKPDVVFLDIEMPDISGIELAREFFRYNNKSLIVFATAYDDYAIEAFELGAVDYILKPFEEKRIAKTIIRIENLKKIRMNGIKILINFQIFLKAEKFLKRFLFNKKQVLLILFPM